MNRSSRPQKDYPQPPYPWLGLSTAAATPLLVLAAGWESGLLMGFGIPVGPGVTVPVGLVIVIVAAFPLMMPSDVRYLAAVVSMVLTGALAVLLIRLIGAFLIPVVVLLFFVWATNHPTLVQDIMDSEDPRAPKRPEKGPGDGG
ncbi:hypothetical protein [Nocardiopsis ganjiahuensis]|uniref:hypothetical protein n=1 Tax=Nocardiopsis ganjiahuensis TaxID=239984 RepID=UPI00034AA699|nr:hypothetical protein [Nocardiopsis ganjiahuensis]